LKLPHYTLSALDLTTQSFCPLGGNRRRYQTTRPGHQCARYFYFIY
jgi:hypothetical protein